MTLLEIANRLTVIAQDYPDYDEQAKQQTVFNEDGLKIRCCANRNAILAVAAKYRKGPIKRTSGNIKYYGTDIDTYPGPVRVTPTGNKYAWPAV